MAGRPRIPGEGIVRVIIILVLVFVFIPAGTNRADESSPIPAPIPQELPSPRVRLRERTDASVEHLLKAAEHLEAAGLTEEAAKARATARQRAIHDGDLGRKEAELECLQEEVDRLRELTGQPTRIAIDFAVLDVSRSKLGMKAREFDKLIGMGSIAPELVDPAETVPTNNTSAGRTIGLVEANPLRLPLFKELKDRGAIRATYADGVKFPLQIPVAGQQAKIEHKNLGVQIDFVGTILANQHIRLQTTIDFSQLDFERGIELEGALLPGISTRRIQSEIEVEAGQSVTLFKAPPQSGANSKKNISTDAVQETGELLVIITPRVIPRSEPEQVDSITAASAEDDPQEVVPADAESNGPSVPIQKRDSGKK